MSPVQAAPNPLRPEDIERIHQALQLCALARELIERYAACGENCQSHADTERHIRTKLEALKAQFGGQ